MELLFPIIYLGFGFYISSLNFVSNGQSLLLTDSSLFPKAHMLINNAGESGS